MSAVWMSEARAQDLALAAKLESVGAEYEGESALYVSRRVVKITIRGPIENHASTKWPSYEWLHDAFVAASNADAIVLDIDSPGGLFAGMLEACRAIRSMTLPPVFACVNTTACSAAYAVACIADYIYCPPSAEVGSIGVMRRVYSEAASLTAKGVDYRMVKSGRLKCLGDPNLPIDEDTISNLESLVKEESEAFFDWVEERRGIDPRGFEGAAFGGMAAEGLGLTDGLWTLREVMEEVMHAVEPFAVDSEEDSGEQDGTEELDGEPSDDDSSDGQAPAA